MSIIILNSIMTIFCIIYMGALYVSTNTLLKAQPSSNDVLNFKVLMMIHSSLNKFNGMLFICFGLIISVCSVLFGISLSSLDTISLYGLGIHDALMIVMLSVISVYLFTQFKLNRLFNSIGHLSHAVPTDIKVQINQLTKTQGLMFLLFCIALSGQITLHTLRIA